MRTRQEIDTAFAPRAELGSAKRFFFVGIGGAGMSSLARMAKRRGIAVLGTDSTESEETKRLVSDGIEVHIGHTGEALQPGDAVILTDAIDLKISPEVQRARELGCPLFRRSQLLGWLLQGKRLVAVTGTHGKTTTTAMVGSALRGAGLDPTIVVGAWVPEFGASVLEGEGEIAVIEACEAYDSLRDLDPEIAVITNLEPDHLDFHGDWSNLLESVRKFAARVPHQGLLVGYGADSGVQELVQSLATVPVKLYTEPISGEMATPGAHNRLSARAAALVCDHLGAWGAGAEAAVRSFRGAERRLQVVLSENIEVIDDYAHHPREIDASLSALRERYPSRRLVVVYQPHLYSRTKDFLPEFVDSLSKVDLLVMTDIYPAREAPLPGISSSRIAEAVACPAVYVPSRFLLAREVKRLVKDGDVVVFMGAGNISEAVPDFLAEWKRKPGRIAVAYGGDSAEREVSLHSGLAVAAALRRRGYEVQVLDLSERLLSGQSLAQLTGANRPDAVFLCVHGNRAEDGAIQGLCEMLHLPHTGSDIQSSAVCMDKHLTKQILTAAGVRVPFGVKLQADQPIPSGLPEKVVVKPNEQGSTVGLSFVQDSDELEQAVRKAFSYAKEVLIEEWLVGMEISVPVLCGQPLPAVEIVPKTGRYDFASKYEPGATEEICPARLPEEMLRQVEAIALRCHQVLGCRGASRTDMIVTESGPVVLELNSLPGMTATSLLPNSAKAAGIEFDELCERILKDALS